VWDLQGQQTRLLRDLADLRVRADEPDRRCPKCQGPMRVRKTRSRSGMTLAHGSFLVREIERTCARGCTERKAEGKGHRALVRRPEAVARVLPPRCRVGYDVLVHVGLARFVHQRQRQEIREALVTRWGVEISSGEVSALAARFCVYLKALHLARAKPLRAALDSDGGWPLLVDATCEDGRGTLLTILAGWRGWVLGAWKIPTESANAVLPRMRESAGLFGPPCAVMHDFGRAVIEASRDFVASLEKPIPNLGCHLHFVADVGKDLLRKSHEALHELFRRFEVVADLRSLVRDLGRRLGSEIDAARVQVTSWLESEKHPFRLPAGAAGFAAVRALAQWTLDWAADGHDHGFPFDRPWLDLYSRCLKTCRMTEACLSREHDDSHAYQAARQLFAIVVTVRSEVPFGKHAATLTSRAKLLDDLRAVLRLDAHPHGRNTAHPWIHTARQAAREVSDIEAGLEQFTESLRLQRPARGPGEDKRAAIDLILSHLERHGNSLFGHVIALPHSAGGGVRVVERTNVPIERTFDILKHGERRRSGRKNIAQDLECYPPDAMLALNLRHQDYLDILCGGSLDGLPAAFAALDADRGDASLPTRRAEVNAVTALAVTRSMTNVDRRLVRTEAMNDRIDAAARSRSLRLG